MKTYTFYLKNGESFKVKGKLKSLKTNTFTGEITSYEFEEVKNIFAVNFSEIIAIVEDLEE